MLNKFKYGDIVTWDSGTQEAKYLGDNLNNGKAICKLNREAYNAITGQHFPVGYEFEMGHNLLRKVVWN